jgi:hypothetical protein
VSRPEQFQPQSYRPRGGRSDRWYLPCVILP